MKIGIFVKKSEKNLLAELRQSTVRNAGFAQKILDSLMACLGEKRKTEFSWTQANKAMSESRISEQEPHFLR